METKNNCKYHLGIEIHVQNDEQKNYLCQVFRKVVSENVCKDCIYKELKGEQK